jgi:hypothetical protein
MAMALYAFGTRVVSVLGYAGTNGFLETKDLGKRLPSQPQSEQAAELARTIVWPSPPSPVAPIQSLTITHQGNTTLVTDGTRLLERITLVRPNPQASAPVTGTKLEGKPYLPSRRPEPLLRRPCQATKSSIQS